MQEVTASHSDLDEVVPEDPAVEVRRRWGLAVLLAGTLILVATFLLSLIHI